MLSARDQTPDFLWTFLFQDKKIAMETSWFLAATVLILGATLMWREFENRRQVRSLIERLNQIDVSMDEQINEFAEETTPETTADDTAPHPTADILHGRTTYVQRLIDGERKLDLRQEEQAIIAIYDHITATYSPAMLADDLHISLRTLERGISLALGCSPRKLIVAVKMREAYRLLSEEKLSVTAVSYRLGFSSPSHFSRRFKTFYRISPSEVLQHRPSGNRND